MLQYTYQKFTNGWSFIVCFSNHNDIKVTVQQLQLSWHVDHVFYNYIEIFVGRLLIIIIFTAPYMIAIKTFNSSIILRINDKNN
jgi:hypothetical protein